MEGELEIGRLWGRGTAYRGRNIMVWTSMEPFIVAKGYFARDQREQNGTRRW